MVTRILNYGTEKIISEIYYQKCLNTNRVYSVIKYERDMGEPGVPGKDSGPTTTPTKDE